MAGENEGGFLVNMTHHMANLLQLSLLVPRPSLLAPRFPKQAHWRLPFLPEPHTRQVQDHARVLWGARVRPTQTPQWNGRGGRDESEGGGGKDEEEGQNYDLFENLWQSRQDTSQKEARRILQVNCGGSGNDK